MVVIDIAIKRISRIIIRLQNIETIVIFCRVLKHIDKRLSNEKRVQRILGFFSVFIFVSLKLLSFLNNCLEWENPEFTSDSNSWLFFWTIHSLFGSISNILRLFSVLIVFVWELKSLSKSCCFGQTNNWNETSSQLWSQLLTILSNNWRNVWRPFDRFNSFQALSRFNRRKSSFEPFIRSSNDFPLF